MEKKNMYDVRGNRRPVSDLSEDERQEQIEMCKRQLEHLRGSLAKTRPTSNRMNNDINGIMFKEGSPESIMLQIESTEKYLAELTKKERTEEMFAVLNEFGNE